MKAYISLLALLISFCPLHSQHGSISSVDVQSVSYSPNEGQFPSHVLGFTPFSGGYAFVEEDGFTFSCYSRVDHGPMADLSEVKHHVYRQKFASAKATVSTGSGKKSWTRNFFLGQDENQHKGGVEVFEEMTLPQFIPGIDLNLSQDYGNFKYTFHVNPGANPDVIQWSYEGADEVFLENGHLIIRTTAGDLTEMKPIAWTIGDYGSTHRVRIRYQQQENGSFGFYLPDGYDENRSLIIDPVLVFSTYSGSSNDNWGFTATFDALENAYGGGIVNGAGYPTTVGAAQEDFGQGGWDVAITKFTPDGTDAEFSTYLGGDGNEAPSSMVVDNLNRLVVFGCTGSYDFPLTFTSFGLSHSGGENITPLGSVSFPDGSDFFVTRFNAEGSAFDASTYVGGSGTDGVNQNFNFNYGDLFRAEVIVDQFNRVIASGSTNSQDFPTTEGVQNEGPLGSQDGVAFRLSENFAALQWSSYIGGSGDDTAYALEQLNDGSLYVVGATTSTDIEVSDAALNPSAMGDVDGYVMEIDEGVFISGTYVGTSGYDATLFVESDTFGNIWITGQTDGDYPLENETYIDAGAGQYFTKLTPDLETNLLSTTYGADASFSPINICQTAFLVDDCNRLYVSGWGGTLNFTFGDTNNMAVSDDAFQSDTDGSDFYVAAFDVDVSSLLYGSYFGGDGLAEHVDGGTSRFSSKGTVYQAVCAGCGGSDNFPTTDGVFSETNNAANCNMAVFKLDFELAILEAVATASPTASGCVPFEVEFNNQGSNGVDGEWDFGNGETSSEDDPTVIFDEPGIYDVLYISTDENTCNVSDTAYLQIEVGEPLDMTPPDFIWTSEECSDSALVSITYTGGEVYDFLIWDMGDGNFANGTDFDYLYEVGGDYDVTALIIDDLCNDTLMVTQLVEIDISDIVIAEAGTTGPASGCLPLTVDFTNAGSNAVVDGVWDFDNGLTSTEDNPTITFDEPGIYEVSYITTNNATCNVADTAFITIEVGEPLFLEPSFEWFVEECAETPTVEFVYTGTEFDIIVWTLGDGNIAQEGTFTHTYDDYGTYDILLNVFDELCDLFAGVFGEVVIEPPGLLAVAEAEANELSGCTPLEVDFSNAGSQGDGVWDFGTGITSSADSPTYTFQTPGEFEVSYIVTDTASCNEADTALLSISVQEPLILTPSFLWIAPICQATPSAQFIYNGGTSYDELLWNVNGDQFDDLDFVYQFPNSGTFTASVTITDETCNNSETFTQTLLIDPEIGIEGEVMFPNVFTPSGDLFNPLFRPWIQQENGNQILLESGDITTYFETYALLVYNRWGNRVFESSEETPFWTGLDAEEGVYYYVVRYQLNCSEDGEVSFDGNLHLMR